MKSDKSTPLPWVYNISEVEAHSPYVDIMRKSNYQFIANVKGYKNALFIVRACNNYHKLLKKVRLQKQELKKMKEQLRESWSEARFD